MQHCCTVEDSMVVTPFPKPLAISFIVTMAAVNILSFINLI